MASNDTIETVKPVSDTAVEAQPADDERPEHQLHGLATIGAIKKTWNLKSIAFLWVGAVLIAFTLGYDQQTYQTFQPYATSEFGAVSLISTIAVVQNVVSSVMQQPLAKLADVYGRFEMFCLCIVIITVGEILLASAKNIEQFAGAQVFFTVGTLGLHLLLQILAGDSSDLRNRALMNVVPYGPSLITAWTASYVTSAILADTTWRWGYGVFAIIVPIISIPLLVTLFLNQRKAKKLHSVERIRGGFRHHLNILQQLDPIGLILFSAGLALLLVPITLASSATSTWSSGHIIAMLVVGFVSFSAFIVWEAKWAKWPVVAFEILKARTVLFGIIAAIFDYASWYAWAPYFVTYLIVARNLSVKAATNMSILIPFCAVLGQLGAGVVAKYFGRYKWITVFGASIKLLGIGLMFRYRSANSSLAPLVVAQILQGLGEGVFNTTITGMQASVGEKFMASVVALFITACGVGGAVGAAISGGIWTNILPQKLAANLPTSLQPELPQIYGSLVYAIQYPWDSPEREAINVSYDGTMRVLIIAALVLASLELLAVLTFSDFDLKAVDTGRNYDGLVVGKSKEAEAAREKVAPSIAGTE